MNELTPLNVEALIKKNIATEYRESNNLRRYVAALLCDHDVLDAIFVAIADRLNIETQEGVNLDRIGKIVGQSRNVAQPVLTKFFGFAPHPQAAGFGDPDNPAVGGRFRSPGEALTYNRVLDDVTYRQYIKARIFRNHAHSTPDELITLLKLLLGEDTAVRLTNAVPRPGHGQIFIEKRLNAEERFTITGAGLIPNTVGVTYHYGFATEFPLVLNGLAFVL
jgi:hypothetical protein